MIEGNQTETAPASTSTVTAELCRYELTRSNSDAASSLTAQHSGDCIADARPDTCMAWTNEKHNKYLDSLEASFVQQLHQSSGVLAWCSVQNRSDKDSSKRLTFGINKASEQFTVIQDGQWQKRIFKNSQPLSCGSTIKIPGMHCQGHAGKDSSVLSADPKECSEFHCEEKYLEGKRVLSSRSASSSDQNAINIHYDNPEAIDKEGSGQNFVDDDCEGEPNGTSLAKRLKTAVGDNSSDDQIVPSPKFFGLGNSIVSNSTLEGHAHHEDSSQDFENWSLSSFNVKFEA